MEMNTGSLCANSMSESMIRLATGFIPPNDNVAFNNISFEESPRRSISFVSAHMFCTWA